MLQVKNELDEYKAIPKSLVFDKELSDRAKFVYIYMSCKGGGWEFFLEPMSKEIGYSKDTLRKYIEELVGAGWIEKGAQLNENGTFGAVSYTIKATKFTDTENFRHGKIPTQQNTMYDINNYNKENNKEENKEEDTNVSPKKNLNYQKIVDCWNEYNADKLGKVTKLTDSRKKSIKKAIDSNGIDQETLLTFFRTLPYGDRWLYEHKGEHKNWKPDFDWWMSNSRGWLTKALEGKVHLENPQIFSSIMSGEKAPYTPQAYNIHNVDGVWLMTGMYFDGDKVFDGYEDDKRPDGATIKLNNGQGTIMWSVTNKRWERK